MKKLVLGIESTAHTIGVALVSQTGRLVSRETTKVLSSELAKYPSSKAGFIPRKLADHHAEHYATLLRQALEKAGVDASEIDAIAFSQGPGLGHSLRVGFIAARSAAQLLDKQLVPVNHTIAHVEVGKWATGAIDPLTVYVSGGNTQILALENRGSAHRYRVYGETLDVGIGNFLDNAGRFLELDPPDAVGVMLAARRHDEKELVDLPYTVKGVDLAFSGLLSAIKRGTASRNALAYAAQENAYAMLVEAAERCLCHTDKKQVMLVGGVAQNPRLQEMFASMCAEHGTALKAVPTVYAGDNGAMIAVTGAKMLASGTKWKSVEPDQGLRIDGQEFNWND